MAFFYPFSPKPLLIMIHAKLSAFLRLTAFYAFQLRESTGPAPWLLSIPPKSVHRLSASDTWHRSVFFVPLLMVRYAKALSGMRAITYRAFPWRKMNSSVLGWRAYTEVPYSVVALYVIDVMAHLRLKKWPTKMLAHHKAMFQYPSIPKGIRMVWIEKINISICSNYPRFRAWSPLAVSLSRHSRYSKPKED